MDLKATIDRFVDKLFYYYHWKIDKHFIFEVHLADQCNLNCAGCSHFSPIADDHFLDPVVYDRDCKRFSELAKDYVRRIHLMGGEPLLHADIINIMKITRKYFQKSEIMVVTNGILLPQMDEQFWNACKENNITVALTLYPVNINVKRICELALQHDIKVAFFGKGYKMIFRKDVLDDEGNQSMRRSYQKCRPLCPQLRNGKFYMCQKPPYIHHINNYFSKEFEVSPEDYLDIYQTKNIKALWKYLRKPIPFCRYCDVYAKDYKIKWHVSKKDFSEWANEPG